MHICEFQRLRCLHSQFLNDDNMLLPQSLAMVISLCSTTGSSIFFLLDGGSSWISVRDASLATPQVACSPVPTWAPEPRGRVEAVEKTRDMVTFLFSVPRSFV